MQHTLIGHLSHAGSPTEAARKADEGSGQERCAPRLVQVQELPHLPVQARIGEGISRQLIAQEIFNDVFCVSDRIEHSRHGDLAFSGLNVYGTTEQVGLERVPEQIDRNRVAAFGIRCFS